MVSLYRYAARLWFVQLAAAQTLSTTIGAATDTASPPPSPSISPLPPPPIISDALYHCWTSYNDYLSEYHSADNNRTPFVESSTTGRTSSLSWDTLASFTTLCDGIPRAVNPPVSTSLIYITTTDYNASRTLYLMPPLSHSSVYCDICDRCPACNSLSSIRDWSSSQWSQQPPPRTPATLSLNLPCVPGTPTPTPPPIPPVTFPTDPSGPRCIVKQKDLGATLFYWPITTAPGGDFCANDGGGTTLTPRPTASDDSPNTAVYNGMTLVSPTAVLVLDALTAQVQYRAANRRSSWSRIGPTVEHAALSIAPQSLSSVHHQGNKLSIGWPLTSHSFDFADMNTVPVEKYSSAHCKGSCCEDCGRIWDVYRPRVGVPPEVTGLVDEWEFCEGWGSVRPVGVPVTAGVTTTVGVDAPLVTGEPETDGDLIQGAAEDHVAVETSDGW